MTIPLKILAALAVAVAVVCALYVLADYLPEHYDFDDNFYD